MKTRCARLSAVALLLLAITNPVVAAKPSAAENSPAGDAQQANLGPNDPEPFQHVIYIDHNPSVSGSVAYQLGTGPHDSRTLTLDAAGDFRNGEHVEIDHAGGPCTVWSAGECHTLDRIIPTITVHGAPGTAQYCVQISVLDGNGGVSRPLNAPGGTCISNAPNQLSGTNYVAIKYNRATKDGQIKPGDQAYAFWASTSGKDGPWTKRGVTNIPTQGINPIVDDKGGAKLLYDEDQIPMLNTSEPPMPDPSDYWWIPDSPPSRDLNDWLLTEITGGGGTARLVLADPIANSAGVRNVRVNHDDGPPIQDTFRHLAPHTEVIFGPHRYRFFKLMFGNGGKSLNGVSIGVEPANDSALVVAGAGINATTLQMPPCFNSGDGIVVQGSPENHVKTVVIRDLTIDNQGCGFLPNGPTSAALNVSYADDVAIERVNAINGATATVWVGAGVDGYYFDQSEASGGWGDVFHAVCGRGEPCPTHLWVMYSTFPFGGADGGFGIMSDNPSDAPQDVHVDYNTFDCGTGFQGATGGDFIGNQTVVDNKHVFDAGLFAPDGVFNHGNTDLYIAFNTFNKKTAYGYGGTDLSGNPPSAIQLGNINTSDNLNPTAAGAGPIRFEHNTVMTNEPINVFVCSQSTKIENNSISDFGGGANHHGLHLACKPGVTANKSNVMGGNHFSGQGVAIYTGSVANVPEFTSWGGDATSGVAKLIDDPAKVKTVARPATASKSGVGVSESDGIQRQQASIPSVPAVGSKDITVTWAKPFVDTNYTPACTVLSSQPAPWNLRVHRVISQTPAKIAVHVVNDDPQSSHGGTLTCQALHD